MHEAAAEFRVVRVYGAESRIAGIKTAVESWILNESRFNRINLVIGPVIIEVKLYGS